MKNAGRAARAILLLACPFFFAGCATSWTHRVDLPSASASRGAVYLKNVPAVAQKSYQCGPAALESVGRYWGESTGADVIGKTLYSSGTGGVFNFSLAQYMKAAGFWTEIHEDLDEEGLKLWIKRGVPPVAMLDAGVLWARAYHFVVLKGFDDGAEVFYANVGTAETQAVGYGEFGRRWKKADRWCLMVCPPEKVDWELDEAQSVEIALIFEKKGSLGEAERRLEAALVKNPESYAAKFNLGNIYEKSGRREAAEAVYRELSVKNPKRSEASNNLASIYYEEGRFEDALRVILAAFRNGASKNFDILDTAGMIYQKLGRIAEARRAFSDAEGRIPTENASARAVVRGHLDALPLRVSPQPGAGFFIPAIKED